MPVLVSTANFMPTNLAEAQLIGAQAAPLHSLRTIADLAFKAQADGVELMPLHSPAWWELQGKELPQAAGAVAALHQTFVGLANERPSETAGIPSDQLDMTPEDPSLAGALLTRIVMPGGHNSLRRLATIATRLGEPALTCVMYPHPTGDLQQDQRQAGLFPGRALVQYTADVAGAWGINPADSEAPERLVDEYRQRGYRAVTPSFHGGRLGKTVRIRPAEHQILAALLATDMVGEVHAELARTDFQAIDPERSDNSVAEAVALLKDEPLDGLPLERTLTLLREAEWQGNLVAEITLGGMATALRHAGHNPNRANIFAGYRTINARLRSEVPSVVAPQKTR